MKSVDVDTYIILSNNECKEIQVQILEKIDSICKKNNIKYSLGYGTLIGSIRHKGFIPWDDDIDIYLIRDDYEKLIEILKKQQQIPWLGIIDGTSNGYYYPFAKAVDNRTIAKEEDNITPHGIWVDIFPIDNLPDDENECNIFLKRCEFLRAMVIAMTTDFSAKENRKNFSIKRILRLIAKIIGYKKMKEIYDSTIKKYNYQNTNYAGCLCTPYIKRERFPRNIYNNYISVEFEGRSFSAIKNYDLQLKQLYGEYMQLPPVEKRKCHHLTVVRKKESL